MIDGVDWDHPDVDVRFVQPYEDRGPYRCPGCDHEIPRASHHVVAVPTEGSDLRRHWHTACWARRGRRRPTRRR